MLRFVYFGFGSISMSRDRCWCCIASPPSPRCTSSWEWPVRSQLLKLQPFGHLRAVVILGIVDEDSSFGLNVASLEVVHDPKAIVKETLVVVVEVVVLILAISCSCEGITGLSLRISSHVGEPRINRPLSWQ